MKLLFINDFLYYLKGDVFTLTSLVLKLVIGFILGGAVGLERQTRRQRVGIRTFSLIGMGCTAAMIISLWIPQILSNEYFGDPGRVAAQILTGIGFLGAGVIMQNRGGVHGLTTAASIWVVAIIGMCVGCGLYLPALILTILSLIILITLSKIELRHTLSGETKVLNIHYDTETPDRHKTIAIIKSHKIYIYSVALENDYVNKTSQMTLQIQTAPRDTLDELFQDIKQLGHVKLIRLGSLN